MRGRLRDQERCKAPELTSGEPTANQHAVRRVDSLVDRRPERIELGKLPALRVGNEEANRLVPVREPLGDAGAECIDPLAAERGDLEGMREPVREPPARERVDRVDLVQHELDR